MRCSWTDCLHHPVVDEISSDCWAFGLVIGACLGPQFLLPACRFLSEIKLGYPTLISMLANPNKAYQPTNPTAKAIMRSVARPPGDGFTHLGSDGVLRAIDGNRRVIDYHALSPEEIDIVLGVFPPQYRYEP
ncbi:uncharacterized protein BDV17DRAFT_272448 [Aspergillus undulatus]|uniref:uncharacterized protein n=1 Tax=Aspergillus undulatus TaxID=1810928 RepID=UPI003CCD5E98